MGNCRFFKTIFFLSVQIGYRRDLVKGTFDGVSARIRLNRPRGGERERERES